MQPKRFGTFQWQPVLGSGAAMLADRINLEPMLGNQASSSGKQWGLNWVMMLQRKRSRRRCVMADRKQFLGVVNANETLLRLLSESRNRVVTDTELREQRVSFAFGNALNSDRITKISVRQASQSVRLFATPDEQN
jgi:hypothetical protein